MRFDLLSRMNVSVLASTTNALDCNHTQQLNKQHIIYIYTIYLRLCGPGIVVRTDRVGSHYGLPFSLLIQTFLYLPEIKIYSVLCSLFAPHHQFEQLHLRRKQLSRVSYVNSRFRLVARQHPYDYTGGNQSRESFRHAFLQSVFNTCSIIKQ